MAYITLILETADEVEVADIEHRVQRAAVDAAVAVAGQLGGVINVKSATVTGRTAEPSSARHSDEVADDKNPREDNSRTADAEANGEEVADTEQTDDSGVDAFAAGKDAVVPNEGGPTQADAPLKDDDNEARAAKDNRHSFVGPEAEKRVADEARWEKFRNDL